MANVETVESEGKATSGRSVENLYKDKAGKLHARPPQDLTGIVKKFKDTGDTLDRDLSAFPEHILLSLAAFGLHQVLQNAYGAAKDTAEKIELAEGRLENLEAGNWSSDRQSGPGTSILIAAFIRAYETKNGKTPTDDWVAQKREQMADEAVAKEAQKRPAIAAALAAIKAERAQERAAKLAKASDDADSDDFLD